MKDIRQLRLAGALALAWAAWAAAGPTRAADPADKGRFTLLHPTPEALMRELNTDRPDQTEGPITVDAGHFQLELDLVSYAYDRTISDGGSTRVDTWSVAPFNLRIGLCNDVELSLVIETWNTERTHIRSGGASDTTHRSGFGDVTPRLKWNLWGNDGGRTAFAVLPFLRLPTSQDGLGSDEVEGGLILPLTVELPLGFELGAMTEFDFDQDEDGDGRHTGFVNSAVVSRDIAGSLSGYLEFFTSVSTESGSSWIGTVDAGLLLGLTDHLQLDAGVNVGVTDAADDVNPFLGLTWRF